MKRSLLRIGGMGLLLGAMAVPALCGPKGMQWVRGYEKGLARARSEHKIAVIDFYSDGCTWCDQMDRKTFVNRSVIEMSKRFVMVKVNARKERRPTIRHDVRGFPTLLMVDGNGREVTRIVGYRRPEDLAADLKEALAGRR